MDGEGHWFVNRDESSDPEIVQYRKGDPGGLAMSDQNRADALELLRKAESYILVTIQREKENPDHVEISSGSSLGDPDPELAMELLHTTAEITATTYYSKFGMGLGSVLALVANLVATAQEVHSRLAGGEGEGGI